jgi:hypothetical protein
VVTPRTHPEPVRPPAWRRRATVIAGWLAVIGLGWAAILVVFGGIDLQLGPVAITSNEPLRPFYAGVLALAVYVHLTGGVPRLIRWAERLPRISPAQAALIVTLVTFGVGIRYGATVVTGSDAYGYISQADLWIAGDLRLEQPWVDDVPWRNAAWSFAYLGYRPVGEAGSRAVVPSYSPGLPLVLAGAKIIGGDRGMFLVFPLAGALLVWGTYGLGRRLDSPAVGVLAAVLVASSPAFLLMMVLPMSDVPAAAAWCLSAYFVLSRRRLGAFGAGLAAGLAILIRPNLVFLAGVLGLWYVVEALRSWPRVRPAVIRAAIFSAGVIGGSAVVAAVNDYLYGSPFTSGYGSLGAMFATAHVGPNVRNYFQWLAESSPIGLVGIGALLCPLPFLWRSRDARWFCGVALLFTAGVWLLYFAYLVFGDWSYLRFLLPTWPFIMIGAALVLAAIWRLSPVWAPLLVSVVVMLVVATQVSYASRQWVFHLGMSERHYAGAALAMRSATPDNAVVMSMQHSGTLQYYGGRLALRYDEIDRDALDSVVAWLEARGVPVFALLQDFEIEVFARRFDAQRIGQELPQRRVLVYDGSSPITLYRLSGATIGTAEPPHVPGDVSNLGALPPSPTPHPPLRLSRPE